jgi:hypothetical protein
MIDLISFATFFASALKVILLPGKQQGRPSDL